MLIPTDRIPANNSQSVKFKPFSLQKEVGSKKHGHKVAKKLYAKPKRRIKYQHNNGKTFKNATQTGPLLSCVNLL